MSDDFASLTIHSQGDVQLFYLRAFLATVDMAYNHILLAEQFILYPSELRNEIVAHALEGGRRFGRMVPLAERVRVKSVELRSPGFWEFVGKLNPLEQIRLYLNDRHERRKDRNYRERAEAERLSLDNEMRATEVLRAKIATAKEMGATDEELKPLLDFFVRLPLTELDRYQNEGLIKKVELKPMAGAGEGSQKELSVHPVLSSGARKIRK